MGGGGPRGEEDALAFFVGLFFFFPPYLKKIIIICCLVVFISFLLLGIDVVVLVILSCPFACGSLSFIVFITVLFLTCTREEEGELLSTPGIPSPQLAPREMGSLGAAPSQPDPQAGGKEHSLHPARLTLCHTTDRSTKSTPCSSTKSTEQEKKIFSKRKLFLVAAPPNCSTLLLLPFAAISPSLMS